MDGIDTLKDVTVLAATNRPDSIDPALLRPGRFDRVLYVAPPDYDARVEIIKINTRKIPNNLTNEQVKELASMSDKFSGAELSAACREAALNAIRKNNYKADLVDFEDFVMGMKSVTPRITEEMLAFYENYNVKSNRG